MSNLLNIRTLPHATIREIQGQISGNPRGAAAVDALLERIDQAPFGRQPAHTRLGVAAGTLGNDGVDHYEVSEAIERHGERMFPAEASYLAFLRDLVAPMHAATSGGGITTGEYQAVYAPMSAPGVEVKTVDTLEVARISDPRLRAAAQRVDETRPGSVGSPIGTVTFAELRAAFSDDLMAVDRGALEKIVSTYMYTETRKGAPIKADLELYANPTSGVSLSVARESAFRFVDGKAKSDVSALRIRVPEGCNVLVIPTDRGKAYLQPVALRSTHGAVELGDRSAIKKRFAGYDLQTCIIAVVKPGAAGAMPTVVERFAAMLDLRDMGALARPQSPVKVPLSVR